MKHAIFSDYFLSYFRLEDNGSTLVLTDERGYTRAVSLLPYEERPQGEWKTVKGIDGDEYYECSNCGEPWVLMAGTPKDNNMNFCPQCGADMRGGE